MSFAFYKPVSIQHNQVPSNQSNFPVLFNFTDGNLKTVANGGNVQNSSGFDIGFYSDNLAQTKLAWEIERYTATSGELVAWIKIPTISSSPPDTVFYLFYGDPTITTDQSNASGVWSNGYISVYHLKDGTTLSVADSLNANNGTNNGATATAGQVDGGASFASASSQFISLGTGINPTAITIEGWVNATSFPNAYNSVVGRSSASSNCFLFIKSNGKLAVGVQATVQESYDGTGSHTLSTSTWYHLVMTYDSTNGGAAYVNAASDGTFTANGNINTTASGTDIGQDVFTAGRFWNGVLDEIRISNVARSADWVTCSYNNHKTGSTFVNPGGQTPSGQIPSFLFAWS